MINFDRPFKGQIKDFPVEVVTKMCEYQIAQGNKSNISVFESCNWAYKSSKGFNWGETPEGYDFWYAVIYYKKFDLFFEKYPKQMKQFKNKFAVKGDKFLLQAMKEALIEIGHKWNEKYPYKSDITHIIVNDFGGDNKCGYNQSSDGLKEYTLPQDWDKVIKLASEVADQSKTLAFGDIKVIISKGKIECEGKIVPISFLNEILEDMEDNIFHDNPGWKVTFPQVKIGCTTFSIDDIKLIINTYEQFG